MHQSLTPTEANSTISLIKQGGHAVFLLHL